MSQSFPHIASIVNFAILVGVLIYLLRKPVSSFLITRSEKVEKNLQESEALRQEALDMLTKYQDKISSLDDEIERILNKAKQDGESEKEVILARAEKLAQQIVDNAKRSAEREATQIRKRIEKQCMQKALEQAKTDITEKATEQDHNAFVDHFLTQMEQSNGLNR